MKTARTLSTDEVKQAIVNFLFDRNILSEDFDISKCTITVLGWDQGYKFEATIVYHENVINITST